MPSIRQATARSLTSIGGRTQGTCLSHYRNLWKTR
ncbi:hypothetical protein ACP4OV_025580 [Aristida adscensionis]